MSDNVVVGGVVVAPIVVQLGVAVLATVFVSWILLRIGFYRLTWHRPLVELAIFCIVLGALVVAVPDGRPLVAPDARDTPKDPNAR